MAAASSAYSGTSTGGGPPSASVTSPTVRTPAGLRHPRDRQRPPPVRPEREARRNANNADGPQMNANVALPLAARWRPLSGTIARSCGPQVGTSAFAFICDHLRSLRSILLLPLRPAPRSAVSAHAYRHTHEPRAMALWRILASSVALSGSPSCLRVKSHRKILRVRVQHDKRAGRLLGMQLELVGQRNPEPFGAKHRQHRRLVLKPGARRIAERIA